MPADKYFSNATELIKSNRPTLPISRLSRDETDRIEPGKSFEMDQA